MDRPNQKNSKIVLPITSIVTFLGFLDTHLLIPIMALYVSELGAGVGITGLIVGLYSITNTPANILFGRLIDRVGYKMPLVAGLFGDALGMFFYSLCPSWAWLALVRVFHGISGGLVGPSTMSITADYSTSDKKGRAMGFYGMSIAAATLAGYGGGGVIASRLGYKAVFLLGAGLLGAGAVLSLLLPGNNKRRNTAAKTPLTVTLRQVKDLLGRKGLTVSYCSVFAQYFTFGGVVTLLPIYLKSLEMEAFHVGMLLATFAIAFIISQFPSGTLSDRAGRLTPAIAGLCLGIASLVILPSVKTLPLLIAVMALYGIAYGLLFPSISALVADNTIPEERGMATGLFHALLTAGVAVGAPVIGWLGEITGVQTGLLYTPAILVVALAVALFTAKRA